MRSLILIAAILCLQACRTNQSPEAQVTDLQITAQVKAKLARDVGPSTMTNVSVNTTNGVVTLSGQVDSTQRKSTVLESARAVPKVVRVVDALQVTTKTP